mmetsp:Transcript_22659/g.37475  ORF Transcript_22659/g.37475 Transcript_22659/m.37475 type:complete len:657 (-) Transcript_22659:153-2123(-)|eukprot:CAMPEP_0119006736 /NCGR_PEP_ID=MMETSP1176-20130426/2494_1 /TAXON_ID=265551 /ORGANISM="Synedropsis recta cf, Strain CCMP1620" /LENGTH=656 /DNA_ID=CAMNT_0006958713 /DNA_START=1251 /DNA_END=3221 /DNA_ORIENTATION=-
MSDISRRSLPRRAAKRKSEEFEAALLAPLDGNCDTKKSRLDDTDETPAAIVPQQQLSPVRTGQLLSYQWIDEGKTRPNGQVDHQLLEMVIKGKTTIVAVGDAILLSSGNDDGSGDQDAFVAKVDSMWQQPTRKNKIREHCMKIRAQWFFKKMDVQDLRGPIAGPISKQALLANMNERELLLSNQYDDNDVLTVLGKCNVVKRRPGDYDQVVPELPPGVWLSRYNVDFGDATPATTLLTAYDGENQPWPDEVDDSEEEMVEESEDAARIASTNGDEDDGKDLGEELDDEADDEGGSTRRARSSSYQGRYSEDDTDESMLETSSASSEIRLSEGPNTKGKISIGPDHQAGLEGFHQGQAVVSRNPVLVWKKDAGATVDMDKYLAAAAEILVDYMVKNSLLTQDPYFPLPEEQMEQFLKTQKLSTMTLSNLSTGSSMTKSHNKLTRECKLDSLIALLNAKEYNVEEALREVKASPHDYVTSWTKMERLLFDSGFRRYSGSLRMIRANSLDSKTFKDIVDYHYRFKIPDQFRRYQDKKREHAVRMMEIIENRRTEDSTIPPREGRKSPYIDEPNGGRTDWSKTPTTDVVGVVEERRTSAKDLLMEIHQAVGPEKMAEICKAIKTLERRSIADLKERAGEILRGHPMLLDKFVEYLPRQYR